MVLGGSREQTTDSITLRKWIHYAKCVAVLGEATRDLNLLLKPRVRRPLFDPLPSLQYTEKRN